MSLVITSVFNRRQEWLQELGWVSFKQIRKSETRLPLIDKSSNEHINTWFPVKPDIFRRRRSMMANLRQLVVGRVNTKINEFAIPVCWYFASHQSRNCNSPTRQQLIFDVLAPNVINIVQIIIVKSIARNRLSAYIFTIDISMCLPIMLSFLYVLAKTAKARGHN